MKDAHTVDEPIDRLNRREFVRRWRLLGDGRVVLAVRRSAAQATPPAPVETNVADFMKVPKDDHSLPGPFPGKVVKVTDTRSLVDDRSTPRSIARDGREGASRRSPGRT